MGLRIFLGHGASGTAASMAPFVDGLRARGLDATAIDLPQAQGRGRAPGVPPRRSRRRADVVVGGHSFGGRVASLAAAEPDAPYAALVLLQLPAPSARRPGADRCPDRPLAGHPLPGPAAVGRVGPVRADRPAAGRGPAPAARRSWSRTRGSATRSSRSSTTSSTGSRAFLGGAPGHRLMVLGALPGAGAGARILTAPPGRSRRCRRASHVAPTLGTPPDRHRAVPVGRSCIASPDTPPPDHRPRPPDAHRPAVGHRSRDRPGQGPAGSRQVHERHRSRRIRRATTRARNKTSGAYGKYQIMPSNWPSWAQRYLGDSKAKPTPANQEKVAARQVQTLYKGLHSWRRVAYWWLTGSSQRERLVDARHALRRQGHALLQEGRRRRPSRGAPHVKPASAISERSAGHLHGPWKTRAAPRATPATRVRYATSAAARPRP